MLQDFLMDDVLYEPLEFWILHAFETNTIIHKLLLGC